MIQLTLNDINRLLLYKQHLTGETRTQDLVKIVRDIAGLHATIPMTPYLSLLARYDNFTKELLDEELYVKKHFGKIRGIRKTIYIFPKELIPIIHAATNRMNEKQSRKALEYRGFSSDTYQTISESILKILKDRNEEMTAPEIKKALHTELNVSYVLYHMCDQKLIIRGRPRKYSLFEKYFSNLDLMKMSESEAIAQLVHHHLQAFGPVTEKDIVWWTGLRKTLIKKALAQIQDKIQEIKAKGLDNNFLILQSDIDLIESRSGNIKYVVNLLPALDPYIMGYKERERYLSHNHINYIFDRAGNATSVILSEGQIIGVWDIKKRPDVLKFYLFQEIKENIRNLIIQKASNIGKFICNTKVLVEECKSMIPLSERTAGSFMSPLKEN